MNVNIYYRMCLFVSLSESFLVSLLSFSIVSSLSSIYITFTIHNSSTVFLPSLLLLLLLLLFLPLLTSHFQALTDYLSAWPITDNSLVLVILLNYFFIFYLRKKIFP